MEICYFLLSLPISQEIMMWFKSIKPAAQLLQFMFCKLKVSLSSLTFLLLVLKDGILRVIAISTISLPNFFLSFSQGSAEINLQHNLLTSKFDLYRRMETLFREWIPSTVTHLKDKPHITRRYNVSVNVFQLWSGNSKQTPCSNLFSFFTGCNVFRVCWGVCLIHFSSLARFAPSHFLFAPLLWVESHSQREVSSVPVIISAAWARPDPGNGLKGCLLMLRT